MNKEKHNDELLKIVNKEKLAWHNSFSEYELKDCMMKIAEEAYKLGQRNSMNGDIND